MRTIVTAVRTAEDDACIQKAAVSGCRKQQVSVSADFCRPASNFEPAAGPKRSTFHLVNPFGVA